jgi:hypothetical protein
MKPHGFCIIEKGKRTMKPLENKSSILGKHPRLPLARIPVLGRRHLRRFLAKALLVAVAVASCWTGPSANAATPNRLIVKLKPALAEAMESWVATSQPGVIQPQQGAKTWLAKHSLSHVEPVYPTLARSKRQSGQSYRQMAELVREKFPKRAARRTDAFDPPEVARTYLVVPNARSPAELETTLAGLKADPMVEFAQREQAVHACFVPNDPYFSSSGSWGQHYDDLYGVKAIYCPAAWDVSTGTGIIVAVVDTGIDYTHLDITNNTWINTGEIPGNGIDDDGNGYVDDVRGWDFIGHSAGAPQQDNDTFDRNGHGTHVAGTIAAEGNNGLGIIGVAWGARVMAVKGLSDGGTGWDSVGANAIVYAANNGADVINASWGGQGTSPVLEDALNYAASLGVVFVAAAGNGNADEANFFPANCSAAIAVAALDPNGGHAGFSNFGNRLDVSAPGVDILSLRATNTSMGTPLAQDPGYTRADGTSMAAPHVSGVAALVLSQHPTWSSEEIRQVLRLTADHVDVDVLTGYGRVNALRAVQTGPTLEARILSPANESTASPIMTVAGVAQGPGFGSYILDYGLGDDPTNWLTLATGSNAVNHSTLGTFQTSALPDGRYTIRLRALNLGGVSFEDRIQITVDYDFITTPSRPAWPSVASVYKPGASIAVVGTAAGLNFREFRVEWARGRDATSGWTNSGIALVGDGLGSVTNGLLATWDSGGITQADYYTIRLTSDKTAFTNEAKTYVYLEPDLYSTNWPQWFDSCPSGGVLPARDAQGHTRLIIMNPRYSNITFPPMLWSFALDGSCQTNQLNFGNYVQVAVGDVAGAGSDEVIVADNVVASGLQGPSLIKVFPANAASPITTFPPTPTSFCETLVTLADLNGDGVPEILALGTGLSGSSNLLYVWTSTGTLVSSNFPIAVSDANDPMGENNTDRVMPLLRGDGHSDILVATGNTNGTFSLNKYSADGTPAAWPTQTFYGQFGKMVSGDVNGDGRRKIVVSYYNSTHGFVEVLSPDGATLPGWPVRFPNGGVNVALGDLDCDGVDEIIAEDIWNIYVLRGDGTPFSSAWPLRPYPQLCRPLAVADVNGDGFPEILTTDLGGLEGTELRAYDRDARLVRSWNLLGFDGRLPNFAVGLLVGDFDGNGKLDIAVNYALETGTPLSGWEDHGALTVLALDVPFIRNPHDWPMDYHDPQNTANDFALLTISGTIRSSTGTPIPGVFVFFSNGGATTTTDSIGFYSLSLDRGWTGTATPSLACYSFNPASQSYTNLTASQSGQDYTATATASYWISIASSPSGGGSVTGGGSYNCGTNVTVCATARPYCYSFVNWTEGTGVVSTTNCYTFTAASNRALVANFVEVCPPPTATVTGTNTICSGQQTVVLAALTGQGPWSVTWSCNGVPLLTTNYSTSVGALTVSPTNASLSSVTNVLYTVSAVTESCGCTARPEDLTGGAMITIAPPVSATATGTNTICNGQSSVVLAALTGQGPWSVTWSCNGVPLLTTNYSTSVGALAVSPTNASLSSVTNVFYTVSSVTESDGCAARPQDLTGGAMITIAPPISALVSPAAATIPTNGSATITVQLTGLAPWTLYWSDVTSPQTAVASPATRVVYATNITGLGAYSFTFALTNVNDADGCPLFPTNNNTSEITVINTSGIVRLQNGINTTNAVCPGACTNLLLSLNSWTDGNRIYGSPWTVTLSDGQGPRTVTAPTASTNVLITECLPTTTVVAVTNVVGTFDTGQYSTLSSNQIAGSATVVIVPLPAGAVTSAGSQTNCAGGANPPLFVAFNTGNQANWYWQATNLVCANSATYVPTNAAAGVWTFDVKEVNSNRCEATAFATNVTLVLTACPPTISLAGTNVVIEWLGNQKLLSTTNLARPIQWILLSNPPFALATNYWTNQIGPPPAEQFFKLTNF